MELTFLNHFGILALSFIGWLFIWAVGKVTDQIKAKWYGTILLAICTWGAIEVVYWTVIVFFY